MLFALYLAVPSLSPSLPLPFVSASLALLRYATRRPFNKTRKSKWKHCATCARPLPICPFLPPLCPAFPFVPFPLLFPLLLCQLAALQPFWFNKMQLELSPGPRLNWILCPKLRSLQACYLATCPIVAPQILHLIHVYVCVCVCDVSELLVARLITCLLAIFSMRKTGANSAVTRGQFMRCPLPSPFPGELMTVISAREYLRICASLADMRHLRMTNCSGIKFISLIYFSWVQSLLNSI